MTTESDLDPALRLLVGKLAHVAEASDKPEIEKLARAWRPFFELVSDVDAVVVAWLKLHHWSKSDQTSPKTEI